MGKTTIEWTRGDDGSPGHTVNPIRARLNDAIGHYCEKVSAGCVNCYASRMQPRFGMPPFQQQRRLDVEPFFDATRLDEVLRRKKPTRWFWCDMTDLFGPWVPDAWIDQCFAVMALTPQHTHQILTKRPERMRSYLLTPDRYTRIAAVIQNEHPRLYVKRPAHWPFSNVHLGVSCEDQPTADAMIPTLLETPAAVRFVSAEPLLGPINFTLRGDRIPGWDEDWRYDVLSGEEWAGPRSELAEQSQSLNWVIVGGESGPSARPCDVAWIRAIVEQCRAAAVPCFLKQLGGRPVVTEGSAIARAWVASGATARMDDCGGIHCRDRKGANPTEWPLDLRVREWPRPRT